MKIIILKISVFVLLLSLMGVGCEKDEIPDKTLKVEDYLGKYSGEITTERIAENGWVPIINAVVEKVPTEVFITLIEGSQNQLMIYLTAYGDSIRTQFDPELGYLQIIDKPYSFYLRTDDFPKFDGIYDHAVSTYGNMNDLKDRFGINFLKDFNDSIFICSTHAQKINL